MQNQNINYVEGATASPEKLKWLENHLPSDPGRALDLGCGAGLYSKWLVQRGWKVEALDLNEPPPIPGAQTRKHNLEEGIPFPDRSFNLILVWDVLEHLVHEKQAWEELARVLQAGGSLIGSVPHSADQRLHPYNLTFKHHIDKTHQREYSTFDLEKKLREVGLNSVQWCLKGPVSPQVIREFISFKVLRGFTTLLLGLMKRIGLLRPGELYADIFFAAHKN